MSVEFEFVRVACRDPKANNCPEVATNIPGVVALRDSERPDEVATFTPEGWKALLADVRAGRFDLSA